MKKMNGKPWKWLLVAGMICLMGAFSACQTEEQSVTDSREQAKTDGSTITEETNTMEQVKIYNESTEIFDSFTDLKENCELFADRAPCTLSTLGYGKKDDGGAATYQILKEKPDGIFEKLGNGLWAVVVAEEQVVPQQFGAKGDGKTNDAVALSRAAAYAADHKVKLVLPEADYYTADSITVGSIDVYSQNAKVSFYGMALGKAAIYVESNTNIYGTLNIWTIDNGVQNHGERCALMFGKYTEETSVTHCYIENVVITGGTKHTNGVFITGDSYDITIDRIYIPEGTLVNRALLIHWGNAGDYIVTQDPPTYTQKSGGQPTQHPHDIHIGTIECHGLKKFEGLVDGNSSALSICGCYDIYVDEIIVSDACRALNITGADVGFYFASEELKNMTCRNIFIDKITATELHEEAIYVLGTAGYAPITETWPEIHIKEFYAEAAADNSNTRGLNLHAVGLLEIDKLTLKGFHQRAISVAYGCRDIQIDQLDLIDCTDSLLYSTTRSDKDDNGSITIGAMNVTGNGTDMTHSAMMLQNLQSLTINSVQITNAKYASLMDVYNTVASVRIGRIEAGNGFTRSLVHAAQSLSATTQITVGNLPSGVVLKSGENCQVTVEG
ncbi:MAG: hypothetical protein IJY42_03360 [Clostridia bacterium]|nr:hypothetical protein [Clostridia bacterium]